MKKGIALSIIFILVIAIICILFFANSNDTGNDAASSSDVINSAINTNTISPVVELPEQTPQAAPTVSPYDYLNENVTLPENTVLVSELDDNKNGLFYLGLSKIEVISILDKYGIIFDAMEDSDHEGPGEAASIISFILFDNQFSMMFKEDSDQVDCIKTYGSAPVESTSTQLGYNLGDTYEKMVELYGDDFTMPYKDDEFVKDYEIYEYKMGDHYFQVWFKSDVCIEWRIGR